MCILFFNFNDTPEPNGYKLILASNRDEFYVRPTATLEQWKDTGNFNCFGGVDLEPGREGGTWLAVGGNNEIIKLGILLNITGGTRRKDALGRGMIVRDYVMNDKSNKEYSQELYENGTLYGAFNFVSIEIKKNEKPRIYSCCNSPLNVQQWPIKRCHGFGNSPPDSPYLKVLKGNDEFENMMKDSTNENEIIKNCLRLLQNSDKCWPDNELEKRDPIKGEKLSSIMIREPSSGYGTRTHSIILINSQNKMSFYEETMITDDPDGKWKKTLIEHQF